MKLTKQRQLQPRKRRATDKMVNFSQWPLFVKEQIRQRGVVGYTLRELRQCNKWTQSYVARQLQIGQITVSRLETGSHLPNPILCEKLAELFDCSPQMFAQQTS